MSGPILYDPEKREIQEMQPWNEERDLDAYLVEHPELVKAVVRGIAGTAELEDLEVKLLGALNAQVKRIDLLYLAYAKNPSQSEGGDGADEEYELPPTLILFENKLPTNPTSDRQALAQILDYASVLEEHENLDSALTRPQSSES